MNPDLNNLFLNNFNKYNVSTGFNIPAALFKGLWRNG